MKNTLEQKCKQILIDEGIDETSTIDFEVNEKIHTLSFTYIIETFMSASEESRLVFYSALKKSVDAKDMGVDRFFEGMGQLLLMTHLSKKIEV
ncbi:hypothetical protein M947_08365 [Sulfurimonas hongkongensis]|uniref:Uncharacterized protein n=1 Tax=Sulfurimonas hongkongensis TaxID=1172190 RepID=T0KQE7_9BACT|nr:hypothetical protein [Sulfurimonas hongkongensis]EQB39159.1 hypothetical protein M947_08365 [Sulfurimonas hongkongensis]